MGKQLWFCFWFGKYLLPELLDSKQFEYTLSTQNDVHIAYQSHGKSDLTLVQIIDKLSSSLRQESGV